MDDRLMGSETTGEVAPVDDAFADVKSSVARFLKSVEDGGLDHYDYRQYLQFIREFERFRNGLSLFDHRMINDANRRGLAVEAGFRSMRDLLVHTTRISHPEAGRRLIAAEQLGERLSQTGQVLPPLRPELAAAQRAGDASPEQIAVVEKALTKLERFRVDPAAVSEAEVTLARHLLAFGPKELRYLSAHLMDVLHPDGAPPTNEAEEAVVRERRSSPCTPTAMGRIPVNFASRQALGRC